MDFGETPVGFGEAPMDLSAALKRFAGTAKRIGERPTAFGAPL